MHDCQTYTFESSKGSRFIQSRTLFQWRCPSFLIAVGLLLACLSCFAQAVPLKLLPVMDGVVMSPYMKVLEDSGGTLTIDDVSSESWQKRFRPLDDGKTAYGVSSSAWWVQMPVENQTQKPISWILEVLHNTTDYVDAYQVGEDGGVIALKLGDHRPLVTRSVPSEAFSFPFLTNSGQTNVIYMRFNYESAGIVNLYQEVSTPAVYSQQQHAKGIWLGVFLGAALLVILYNLFFMLSIREAAYFWYLLYACAATVMYLALSGLGFRYVWGFSPGLADAIPYIAVILFYMLAVQFSRSFLDTKTRVPRLDRVLLALVIITSSGAGLFVLGMRAQALNFLVVIGLLLGLFPVLGGWLWWQGHQIARGYTLAWSIWSLTVVSGILRFKGIIPTDPLLISVTRFGMIFETVLLAFALADRINILRSEKHAAQRRERAASQKAKDELEANVLARTLELERSRQKAEILAREDALTGLFNRRAFFERGNDEVNRALRYQHPLSVLMLDIDRFKTVNDSFGHAVGDEVIRAIATALTKVLRESDIKARIGGEEFAVVLIQTKRETALILAERLRLEIEQSIIATTKAKVRVTSSFGVSELKGPANTLDNLLANADDALYKAKNMGRNQVVEAV